MASHDPSKYHFSTPTYVVLYATLLTAYYMFVFLIRRSVLFQLKNQMGHFNVPEIPLQNADAGYKYLPKDLSPATVGHAEESGVHTD
jgi:hypothetical protein